MTETLTIAVTGAGGFIGRHTVHAARKRGHRVRALVRNNAKTADIWANDPLIEVIALDLARDGAGQTAAAALNGVDAVIHAAAAMSGDDAAQRRETVEPTRVLLDAIAAAPAKPRFILVSSISVYSSNAVVAGGMLDETAKCEAEPTARDAYCRAKLAQEDIVLAAAKTHNLDARIMRPGAVFGPDRLWNGHLGHAVGPALIRLESRGEVPVSFVEHCAEALVLAAECPLTADDRHNCDAGGRVEFINIIDDDRPDRTRYLTVLRRTGWPRIVLPWSWRIMSAIANILSKIIPQARLPGLLRPAILRTRMMPVQYSNARLRERLGWRQSGSFEDAMRLATGHHTPISETSHEH